MPDRSCCRPVPCPHEGAEFGRDVNRIYSDGLAGLSKCPRPVPHGAEQALVQGDRKVVGISAYNNRSSLNVTDGERADTLAEGIVGKRLAYRRPNRANVQVEG